jgi:hypothetical protein
LDSGLLDDGDPPQVCNFRATSLIGRNADIIKLKPKQGIRAGFTCGNQGSALEPGDYFLTAVSASFFE